MKQDTLEFELQMSFQKANTKRFTGFSRAAKENDVPSFSATTSSQMLTKVLRTLPISLEDQSTTLGGGYEVFSQTQNQKQTSMQLRSALGSIQSSIPTPKSAMSQVKKSKRLQLSINSSTASVNNSTSSKSQKRRNNAVLNQIHNTLNQLSQPTSTTSANTRQQGRKPANKSNTAGLFRSKAFADSAKPSPKVYSITVTSPQTYPQVMAGQHFVAAEMQGNKVILTNQRQSHSYSLGLDETLQLSHPSMQFNKAEESHQSQESFTTNSGRQSISKNSANPSKKQDQGSVNQNSSYQNVSFEEAQALALMKQATTTAGGYFQLDSSQISSLRQQSRLPVPEVHPLLSNQFAYPSKNQLQDPSLNQSSEIPKFDYKQFIIQRSASSKASPHVHSSQNTSRSQAQAPREQFSHRSSQNTTYEDSDGSLTAAEQRYIQSISAAHPQSLTIPNEHMNYKSTESGKRPSKKEKKMKGTIARFINQALARQQRRSTSLSNPVLQNQQRSQSSCSNSKNSKEIADFAPNSTRSEHDQQESESDESSEATQEEVEQSDHVSEDMRQPEELLSDVEVVQHHQILSHRSQHRHAEVQYVTDNMVSIEIGSHRSHPKKHLERSDANSRHSEQVHSCFSARVSDSKPLMNRSKESSAKQKQSRYGIASSKQTVSPKTHVTSPGSRSSASRCSSTHQKSVNSARASSVKVRQSSTKQSEPKRIRSLQQSSCSIQQNKQSVDSSLTATSSHFLQNEKSKANEDDVLMQLLRHQLRIIASKVEYYANIITIEEVREFSYLTTPPSTAFFKAGRCLALLLKAFTAMDPDNRQIKDEETFTKWERIQQYLNSQQGERQLQRLGDFRQFCDSHFQLVDKTTLCSVLRKEIFSYTLVVKDNIEQVELDLESPRVKNPPVKPYFCIAYFIMTYMTLLDMAGKQQRKINDTSEIFKTDSTTQPFSTLDTHKESTKRSAGKKAGKKTHKTRVKSLTTQKTSGSGLSQSQTTLSIRHTSQNSSSMKASLSRKQKEYSKNLVVRAIQQELNTSKSEKRAKKEKGSTTVKKMKFQSLSTSPMSKTPPSVVRLRPISRQKLVRDSSNEAYGNQESGTRTHNVRQAILNAESDGSHRHTPTQPGITALVLEKSNQDSSKTRGGMDMFSSHLNLNSSAKAPLVEKEQVLNIQIEDKSNKSESFYRLVEDDSCQNTTEDSQIMPTIRVGAEHALSKAESSKLSLANPLPIKNNTEFTFQSQGYHDHRKSYANERAEVAAAYQTGPSRTPDHNARVSDFLTHTINSCAKKGAPVRVDDLIKKIKFEYDSQSQTSAQNLMYQRSQSYTIMPPSDNKSSLMQINDEGNSRSSLHQVPIQIPLVKYTAQSVRSSEQQLSDCYMQRNYDNESDQPAQKVNLLAAQSTVRAGSARVAYPELVSSQGSLLPLNQDVFDELKELAADKESGRIQEVAGEGLVANKLELAFEEFYRQKSTSGIDSDRCSDVTSEKSLQHLNKSVIEEAQAIISSRSSGKYASRAKSICEDIVARELSDVSDFAVSPEKKDVEYKMSRTPAQIVNSLKKRARARSHGKRLFETTIKNKTTEIVQSQKDFVKSTDPSLNCFGGQVADFDMINNSLKKGNFTSVTKGRNTKEQNSIVKKFAFASSRKDGSPASVCKFEPTEPDFLGFVNSLAQTANFTTKKETMGSEIDFNLTGLQKLSDQLISDEADPEQGAQMRTFSLSDYTTSDFAKTYSSTQMITERIFARINEFKKQRTQLLEQ